MKDILQNWNVYAGKTRLTESQIKKIKIKYPVLNSGGVIDALIESQDNFYISHTAQDAQRFFNESKHVFNETLVLKIIRSEILLHNPMMLSEAVNRPAMSTLKALGIEEEPEEGETLKTFMSRLDLSKPTEDEEGEEGEEDEEEYDSLARVRGRSAGDEPVGFRDNPAEECLLSFSADNNAKLSKLGIVSIALPAAYTCPFAGACKTFMKPLGKDEQGKRRSKQIQPRTTTMSCFSAGSEAQSPAYQDKVWYNAVLLKLPKAIQFSNQGLIASVNVDNSDMSISDLILKSIRVYRYKNPGKISLFRIHEGGDFFSQEYFDAWVEVTTQTPDIIFYAYTTSLPYWAKRKNSIPPNFILTASEFTTRPEVAYHLSLKKAFVVLSKREADIKRLPLDVDDFEAVFGEQDFALLLHGAKQPKGIKVTIEDIDGNSFVVNKSTLSTINSQLIKNWSKANPVSMKEVAYHTKRILAATLQWHKERMVLPGSNEGENDK